MISVPGFERLILLVAGAKLQGGLGLGEFGAKVAGMAELRDQVVAHERQKHGFGGTPAHDVRGRVVRQIVAQHDLAAGAVERDDEKAFGVVRERLAVTASFLCFLFAPPARAEEEAPPALPRLVDLGAGKCIPCKKMAPIIEQLRKDYDGIVDVVFVDVWKDPDGGKPYKIRLIPTQVFFDAQGKEVFRHEGFFSREEIEAVFKEKLGIAPVTKAESES